MAEGLKFGLAFASSVGVDSQSALAVARQAESLGFESIWGGEHVIRPRELESRYPYTPDGKMPGELDDPIPDPLIWLSYVAAAAPNVRLGTCILIVPQRNPVVLAKELATLDRLSDGRVELGIGVGWLKEEFEALGIPWERRGKRTDEYIAAMRALWSGPDAGYKGDFVDFSGITCSPRPVNGDIPVIVGGDTPAAVRRAGRLGQGYFPGTSDMEELARLIGEVREQAKANDRDPEAIEISCIFGVQMADPIPASKQLREIGVDRAMVPAFFFAGPGGEERLQQFGETVVKPNRS